MRITGFNFKPFSIPFMIPFRFGNQVLESKEGLIIEAVDSSGKTGRGTSEPFEYFGTESLQKTKELAQLLSESFMSIGEIQITDWLKLVDEKFDNFPAFHSGVEQALLSLNHQTDPHFLPTLLKNRIKGSVYVNAVIGLEESKEILNKIETFIGLGYDTVKIKCGRDRTYHDLKIFMDIRKNFGNSIKLRGDANGKWTKIQAVEILKALEDQNIEYMEQPVPDFNEFEYLKSRVSTPLAADESMKNLDDLEKIVTAGTADYVVVKPIPAGGLRRSIEIINRAENAGVGAVVTTSMDSVIGKKLSVLAASYLSCDIRCGLDTSSFFVNDIENDPYPVSGGKILLNEISV